jgi:hypothetical protein
MIVSGEHFDDVYHLGAIAVTYPRKNIHTAALQVVPENIGSLCVEFQEDLRYEEAGPGRPYFVLRADRPSEENSRATVSNLRVCLGYWIVVLWDQLHVFRDFEFKSTFHIDSSEPQHQLPDDSAMSHLQELEIRSDGALRGSVHDDVQPA